jgi:chromosome segregation ATPase
MLEQLFPNLVTAAVAALAIFFASKDRRGKDADAEADRLIEHLRSRLDVVEKDRNDCRKLISEQAQEIKSLSEKLAYLEGLVRGRDEGGAITGEMSIRGVATPTGKRDSA